MLLIVFSSTPSNDDCKFLMKTDKLCIFIDVAHFGSTHKKCDPHIMREQLIEKPYCQWRWGSITHKMVMNYIRVVGSVLPLPYQIHIVKAAKSWRFSPLQINVHTPINWISSNCVFFSHVQWALTCGMEYLLHLWILTTLCSHV